MNTSEPQAMGYIRSHRCSEYIVINTKHRPPWENIIVALYKTALEWEELIFYILWYLTAPSD